MEERAGFRCTKTQWDFLERARIKAESPSIADWLRSIAADASERLLGEKFPPRNFDAAPRKKSR